MYGVIILMNDSEDEHGDLKPALTILKLLNDWLIMEYGSDFINSDNDDLFRYLFSPAIFSN